MINKLVNHKNAVRNTALSFAVMGTFMHGLNVVHATNSALSQVWSIVAIIGFFVTMTNFVNKRQLSETATLKRWRNCGVQNGANHVFAKNEVSLP
jgi:hypothetical protein